LDINWDWKHSWLGPQPIVSHNGLLKAILETKVIFEPCSKEYGKTHIVSDLAEKVKKYVTPKKGTKDMKVF